MPSAKRSASKSSTRTRAPNTTATERGARPAAPGASPSEACAFSDFVLSAKRKDARAIELRVSSAPSGVMRSAMKPLRVAFSEAEAKRIRDSFRSSASSAWGKAQITIEEASALGKRLAQVLLPAPVFRLLAVSLAGAIAHHAGGLRIRLDMDGALIDLPWEYLYRPDRPQSAGLSGFLLYDQAISLVRLKAARRLALAPIAGAQRLNFVGTLWEGRRDGWEVWREFDQLRSALKPVAKYVTSEFAVASDLDVFDAGIEADTALFHYAGHCDFDRAGRPFCVRELPASGDLAQAQKTWISDLARTLGRTETRVAVFSACNSGYWPVVEPLIKAGVPALIGINGGVTSDSTIEFCTRLYESLALGLSLDEAVGRARLAVMERGAALGLFDWGLYMVYMSSPEAVLFPREASAEVATKQAKVRRAHLAQAASSVARARELEGLNFGEIMSELTRRRVLILGRFKERRLNLLEAIQRHLAQHRNRYIPELFTFKRPDSRDLVESILGFASLSRFVIADLSEPRSVQQELQAIVPNFQSVPIVPIINEGGREFATFASLARRPNVVQPTLRYRNVEDLLRKIDREIVPAAEALREKMLPA
jgi:hypothetical protein